MNPVKISPREKLSTIHDYWNPRLLAELNGQHVKLAKFRGDFIWHHHEHEDELFFVVEGRFRMDLRGRQIWVEPGEMIVVPRGVEHKPYAEDEVSVLLFEPATTVNTGNVESVYTKRSIDPI